MNKKFAAGLVLGIMLAFSGTANATLVGDTVTAEHRFPSLGSGPYFGTASTTVVDGTSDTMALLPTVAHYYDVNVDAASIHVTSLGVNWNDQASFNGLVVSSLNDSTGNALQGVSVSTNLVGWDVARLSFSDDTVEFNWAGLQFLSDMYFNASLDFGGTTAAPVPEPATMLLFGTGIAGLAAAGRRKRS